MSETNEIPPSTEKPIEAIDKELDDLIKALKQELDEQKKLPSQKGAEYDVCARLIAGIHRELGNLLKRRLFLHGGRRFHVPAPERASRSLDSIDKDILDVYKRFKKMLLQKEQCHPEEAYVKLLNDSIEYTQQLLLVLLDEWTGVASTFSLDPRATLSLRSVGQSQQTAPSTGALFGTLASTYPHGGGLGSFAESTAGRATAASTSRSTSVLLRQFHPFRADHSLLSSPRLHRP